MRTEYETHKKIIQKRRRNSRKKCNNVRICDYNQGRNNSNRNNESYMLHEQISISRIARENSNERNQIMRNQGFICNKK